MAQFVFINKYIQQSGVLPKIRLFSDKNVEIGVVDLLVDMGNSRTCAVLLTNHCDVPLVEGIIMTSYKREWLPFEKLVESNSCSMGRPALYGQCD